MLAAMAARRRELVMTAKGRLGLWLKLLAPGLVDRMACARSSRQDVSNKEGGTRRRRVPPVVRGPARAEETTRRGHG